MNERWTNRNSDGHKIINEHRQSSVTWNRQLTTSRTLMFLTCFVVIREYNLRTIEHMHICNVGHNRDERQRTSNNRSYVAHFLFVSCLRLLIPDSQTFDLRITTGITKQKKKGSNIRRVTIRNASNIWFMNDPLSDMIQKLYLWINMRLKCRCSCFLQFTRWCAIRCVFHRSTT